MKVLAALRTAHSNGEAQAGVDVDGDSIGDKTAEGVVDLMSTKESALRLAVDAAVTVLRVRAALALAFTLGFGFLFWFLWIFFFLVWFLWFIFFFPFFFSGFLIIVFFVFSGFLDYFCFGFFGFFFDWVRFSNNLGVWSFSFGSWV